MYAPAPSVVALASGLNAEAPISCPSRATDWPAMGAPPWLSVPVSVAACPKTITGVAVVRVSTGAGGGGGGAGAPLL